VHPRADQDGDTCQSRDADRRAESAVAFGDAHRAPDKTAGESYGQIGPSRHGADQHEAPDDADQSSGDLSVAECRERAGELLDQ
jgi:phage FluMu gp28-like protein